MLFSIIVVSLNAGLELKKTIDSILAQKCDDFEIIVKDGESTDHSVEQISQNEHIKKIICKDTSIYDAMNQATKFAVGEYYLFLNCGDYFYQDTVLATMKENISKQEVSKDNKGPMLLYGDLYRRKQDGVDVSPEKITDFVCYRNIPCHQVCFYHRSFFEKRGYDLEYPVRADYEHFLYCKYEANATFIHIPIVVASYEGGGFSETNENHKEADKEHRRITKKYLGGKCLGYRCIMILTLQPIRKRIADSKHLSGMYQKVKKLCYQKERKPL